ncbi:ornithine cyclodeaminase family protein [Corynebacterium glutamicum]|uniref:ornithine cyclodeaminase family protein n=1 Tax=Corynebacterium glutamicum TaxID=1718 RepID=UPI000945B380|nr:ornithine cyclodeaminase family protein [Corynebacterium glutamicum]OKX83674.1 hypothetical protein AUO95_04370 [Corynebacterium glutamicum]
MTTLPYVDATMVRQSLPWKTAIEGIELALRNDIDPEADGPRLFAPNPNGDFLIMPASSKKMMGVKVLTISPQNPDRGLEKIQGTYLLFDADTSAPTCIIDGTEITSIRTPAVTLTGLRALAANAPEGDGLPDAPQVLVFGAGTQAINHIRAVKWAWPNAQFTIIGRSSGRIKSTLSVLRAEGIDAIKASSDIETAVRTADIIITVTTSPKPLFDGNWVQGGALVASVGQHGLDAREVDAALVLRSDIVLESRGGMFREGGNIIPARSKEEWETLRPANIQDAVLGRFTRKKGRPALFTGVGMSWEDLVLANIVFHKTQFRN